MTKDYKIFELKLQLAWASEIIHKQSKDISKSREEVKLYENLLSAAKKYEDIQGEAWHDLESSVRALEKFQREKNSKLTRLRKR